MVYTDNYILGFSKKKEKKKKRKKDNYIPYEEKKIHSEANKIKQASHAQFLLYSMILFIKVVSHDSTHCEEQIYAPCVSNQKSKHSGLSPQTVDFILFYFFIF